MSYALTLDADLQASRVTSRGLFTKNGERFLTEKAKISSTPLCLQFDVYVQVRYILLKVTIIERAHLNTVLLWECCGMLRDLLPFLRRILQILLIPSV